MNRSLVTTFALSALLASTMVACSPAKWREVAPNTGDLQMERQTAPNPVPPTVSRRTPGYVAPGRLRGHTETDPAPDKEPPVILERNDRVEVIDPTPKGPNGWIEVVVVDSKNPEPPKGPIYVNPEYINVEPVHVTPEERDADRYFMIQNIATEKLRVYERCGGDDREVSKTCRHRLVLETDMVAGQPTPDRSRETVVGSFRISKWFKFYEDYQGQFPSWYHPAYPELPAPGASWSAWLSKSLLPQGRGIARGKFGWYTAHLSPNAYAQWTHGTIGWGADGDRFIMATRDPYINEYADPRSAGCSRVENQAIAFIRQIMPAGSKVIKVYAKEAYRDPKSETLQLERARWDWILTKEGYQQDGPLADRNSVLARGVSEDMILEKGTYLIDQKPDAIPFRKGLNGRVERDGNLYSAPESSFRGYLVVDEGRLVDYQHPKELERGGYTDKALPSVAISKDRNVIVPGVPTKQEVLKDVPGTQLPDGTVVNEKATRTDSRAHQRGDHPKKSGAATSTSDSSRDLMSGIY